MSQTLFERLFIRSILNRIAPVVCALSACSAAHSQDTTWTKPLAITQQAPSSAAEQAAQPVEPGPVHSESVQTGQPAGVDIAQYPDHYAPIAGKKNKLQYVGPETPIELAPTPMLDAEGRQRIDPDGKPMFNPPVRQQRDKRGHPLFDEQGKPVMQTPDNMGCDERGKKIRVKKLKAPRTVSMTIARGIFTVDGMTGKAGLNYEIKSVQYIYLYAPWIGTTIVSAEPFPGAAEQKNGFSDGTLTIAVEDHTLQLYSDHRLFRKPRLAYVAVDRNFQLPSKYPVVGFGDYAATTVLLAGLPRKRAAFRAGRSPASSCQRPPRGFAGSVSVRHDAAFQSLRRIRHLRCSGRLRTDRQRIREHAGAAVGCLPRLHAVCACLRRITAAQARTRQAEPELRNHCRKPGERTPVRTQREAAPSSYVVLRPTTGLQTGKGVKE